MVLKRRMTATLLVLLAAAAPVSLLRAQEAAAAGSAQQSQQAQHTSGTVKSTAADSVTLTTSGGQDVTVSVPAAAKVLLVPPGSRDLKSATAGTLGDVAAGDRVLVTAVPGDTSTPMTAARVIVMKSSAIAQSHSEEEAEWQRGGGGIVKSVDPAAGTITVVNGARATAVKTTPSTSFRRYSGGSVRFEDAVPSSLAEVHPGDQLRMRGTRSADGAEITADAIVTGNFQHYSGLISAIDPAAQTVTLKDLATKHTVTVQITPESSVKQLPPQLAQMLAGGERGAGAGTGGGAQAGGNAGAAQRAGGAGAAQGPGGAAGGRRRPDLAQVVQRLPSGSLGELKSGEAVMIVATSSGGASAHPTAITLLSGVEPILAAPGGESMTLSPWSVGGGEPDAGGAQP
jgi:hypothetical protein